MIGKNNRYFPPVQNSPEATITNNPLAIGGTTIGVDACQYFIPDGWTHTDVSEINPVLAVLGPDNADYTYPETVRITGISAATGAGNLTVTRAVGASATIGAAREWPIGTKIASVNTAQQLTQIHHELTYLKDLQPYVPIWDVADTTTITGLSSDTYKWVGAVLAPNGKIYCVPCNSTTVLIIDPATDTADTTTITGLTGTSKWYGAVLAPNGKIYCVPYNSTTVLIIDPATDTADTTTITGLTGTDKWRGAVLAPNGKIYCVPCNPTTVLITTPGFPTLPIAPLLSPYLNKF